MLNKIKSYFMSTPTKNMFNDYLAYFPTINKQLKLLRGGKISVIDKDTKETEVYNNWDELNSVYQLFPLPELELAEFKIIDEPKQKYWCYGNPTRSNELIDFFSNYYLVNRNNISNGFKYANKVYYLDHNHNLCETSSQLVIDLLVNSSEWQEYKLETKKYTKADIAKILGLTVDQFEIV